MALSATPLDSRRTFRSTLTTLALILLSPLAFSPAGEAQVPTFQEVAEHDLGDRITLHHQMADYLRAVAEASDRVQVMDQGTSWEGKDLLLAVVTSPENHARLGEIRRNAQRLGDPRETPPEVAEEIFPDQPFVFWMGGSIHGFELSGSEALLKAVEELTTRDDPAVREILDNVVFLVDPMLNPDGRDAHAHHNHQNIGREAPPHRDDWSNDFSSWEGLKYRTGHYFFDTNRDWFAHTQPETRNRIGTLVEWRPQGVVDLHEMSPDVEFYFDPPDIPFGPYFPEFAREGFLRFNEAYAEAFDSAGFEYMTGERYNYFYPGYTTSHATYQGAVGMLYEQGSTRGLALTRPDGSVRTLADAIAQQYTATWAALRTAATRREAFLRDYHEANRNAVAEGREGYRRYLLVPDEGDPGLLDEVVNLLVRGGVEVDRLTAQTRLERVRDREGSTLGARTFPEGAYVVDAAQPRSKLVRVLLEPDVPLSEEFLKIARHRVDRDENPRFYDITSWSLPLMFNVGGYSSEDARDLPTARVEEELRGPTEAFPPRPGYAYLVDGREAASMGILHRLVEQGHRAAVTLRPTRVEGREVPTGTVVVRVGQNETAVHHQLQALSREYRVEVRGVETGLPETGFPALGSADVIPVRPSEIALVAEDPVSGYSFGFAWHALDRQYRIPATVLRARSLPSADLRRFDVLVLPELSPGAMARLLGPEGKDRLRTWVDEGGTLVALGTAVEFVRSELELLSSLRSWYETDEGRDAHRLNVPGAFFQARLDGEHWLSAGYSGTLPVQVRSDRIYLPPEGPPDSGKRPVLTLAPEEPQISGHAWSESRNRLPGSVQLYEERVGSGRIITFAEDPNFRGYMRGMDRLFLNAVVLGPSAP